MRSSASNEFDDQYKCRIQATSIPILTVSVSPFDGKICRLEPFFLLSHEMN